MSASSAHPRLWRWPAHPVVYEISTWPWLTRLRAETGHPVHLGTVPSRCWDDLAELGMDAVWLMGVWQRSPAGVALALADPGLLASFREALPDCTPTDVVGSPYCVRDYVVDAALGGPDGLAVAREALAQRGIGLVLDFVPNHVAPDHPWTVEHPDAFVRGTPEDLAADPKSFLEIDGQVLANGRDPYFPAWPDVVQLDAFSRVLRGLAAGTLRDIAEQCDGVRCDMAMLMMNDTFSRTWGDRVGEPPATEYWPEVMAEVRSEHPDFRFLAEAYWDLEHALQQQGFDHCYDKRLYDRLLHEDAEQVRLHLCADLAYQQRLLRFVENHDEPRVASLVAAAREKAITVAALTQTGARLVFDGEADGEKVHLPVFLGRAPDEPIDDDLRSFHLALWRVLADRTFHDGDWRLCDRDGRDLVAWCWDGARRYLVVVNLSDTTTIGTVRVPWPDLRGRPCRLVDDTRDDVYERTGDDLVDGMYVELDAWGWHLLRVDVIEGSA